MGRNLFFNKFEGLQPANSLKLNLFTGNFQELWLQFQLATVNNSYL